MNTQHATLSRRAALAVFCGLGAYQASSATPKTYALLVAVSQVGALPKRLWLRGPDNDVALMRQVLQERGAASQNITSLSQAVGGTVPTFQAITEAMQRLVQRVQPGDHVVLHLAGHGVQVPPRPGAAPEPDGLDEVFLAADTQPWNEREQRLPQGLYDHDIGVWLDALAARQVRVLAVFDTCHAAGMHRAASSFTRQRGIAAAELGVPSPGRASAPPAPPARLRAQPSPGVVLALAARAHESTPEEWLPKASPQARLHGVFTYAVVQALREGAQDAASMRLWVARTYAAAGRASPVPMVLGEGKVGL
jgi:hypothetical protein